ncbi:unnamed protein product, partial [Staurois parvus]
MSATYQCQSVPPISASQCRLSVCIRAAYQCPSVLPISATYQCHLHQCCLSVPVSAAYQCQSVPPTSASSSVPITASSLAHISE